MGIRFRKSFKVAPGVRLNVGKKSSSLSFGGKGFRTSVSSSGKRTHTVGIPGTGVSCVSTSGSKRSRSRSQSVHHSGSYQKPASPLMLKVCGVIVLIIGVLALLLAIVAFSTVGAAGIIFLIIGIPCILLGRSWMSVSKRE